MSEEANTPEEKDGEKKKGSKLFLIIGLVVVLALGGGGGYYFFMMSGDKDGEETSEKKKGKKKKKKDSDELVLDDPEEDEESDDEDDGSLTLALPDDEDVTQVVELKPFIVNLADTDESKYLRMTVSLGVGGEEGGGHGPDQLLMTRVKNAMLAVLATKTSEDVLSVKGKAKLRKELLKAAQTVAEDAHIEAIYITDFIVQL